LGRNVWKPLVRGHCVLTPAPIRASNPSSRRDWIDSHRVCYYYAPKLFRELQNAQADGSLLKLLKKLNRAALLVIDDFGVAAVAGKQYRDLLEILDDRQGVGSTLITSQFPVDQWHEVINDATVADAILDRLVHNAYRLELTGESLRKTKAILNGNTKPPAD